VHFSNYFRFFERAEIRDFGFQELKPFCPYKKPITHFPKEMVEKLKSFCK